MKRFSKRNIGKLIILNSVIGIGALLMWLGYTGYIFWNSKTNLTTELLRIEKEYIKNNIRESVLDFIHKLDAQHQQHITNVIKQYASRAENEDMFILDLRSMERGDKINTMLVSPDHSDLLNGLLLNDDDENTQELEFREEFLNGLKKHGELFVKYRDQKPNTDEVRSKMIYFKLYPKRSWIVAQGFYFDDLMTQIDQFKERHRKLFQEKIRISLALLGFSLLGFLCLYLLYMLG